MKVRKLKLKWVSRAYTFSCWVKPLGTSGAAWMRHTQRVSGMTITKIIWPLGLISGETLEAMK